MAMKRAAILGVLLMALGCGNKFKMDAPAGFARVTDEWDNTAFKAADNVGLRVDMFTNMDGGTLTYWSHDLAVKLHRRGYVLQRQSEIRSGNGVVGTRFDYKVEIPGTDEAKFFVVGLFVTDRYRFVMQLAGDEPWRTTYVSRVDEFAKELRLRGCTPGKTTCKGPQPPDMKAAVAKLDVADRR